MTRFQVLKHNLLHTLISFDQLLRCLIGTIVGLINGSSLAYADETLSAWAYRSESRNYIYGKILRKIIDVIMYPFEGFKWDHCKAAYESEINRTHFPEVIDKKE